MYYIYRIYTDTIQASSVVPYKTMNRG